MTSLTTPVASVSEHRSWALDDFIERARLERMVHTLGRLGRVACGLTDLDGRWIVSPEEDAPCCGLRFDEVEMDMTSELPRCLFSAVPEVLRDINLYQTRTSVSVCECGLHRGVVPIFLQDAGL